MTLQQRVCVLCHCYFFNGRFFRWPWVGLSCYTKESCIKTVINAQLKWPIARLTRLKYIISQTALIFSYMFVNVSVFSCCKRLLCWFLQEQYRCDCETVFQLAAYVLQEACGNYIEWVVWFFVIVVSNWWPYIKGKGFLYLLPNTRCWVGWLKVVMLTHLFFTDYTGPPECTNCYQSLTVKHILTDCTSYTLTWQHHLLDVIDILLFFRISLFKTYIY